MGYNRLEAVGRGLQIMGRGIVYAQAVPASVGGEAILERELIKDAGGELRKNRETRRDVSAKIMIGGGLIGGGLFVLGREIEKRGQLRGGNQEQPYPTPELPRDSFPPAHGSTPEVLFVHPQTLPPAAQPMTAQELRETELRNYEVLSRIVGKRVAMWLLEKYVQSVIERSRR